MNADKKIKSFNPRITRNTQSFKNKYFFAFFALFADEDFVLCRAGIARHRLMIISSHFVGQCPTYFYGLHF